MTRHDALVQVIECLHAEITALKANDTAGLERATAEKLAAIEAVACRQDEAMTPELRALAEEAHRLNEAARIYVNLMAANVRRQLQVLAGNGTAPYRAAPTLAYG
ncbi:hypothetical protein [Sphingomonas sp. 37zxx]|uniref:hypothetical protein n=1 Tax=Sphingomonas sp. 37zxx TaxID=1550073 RepID=UPI00053BE11D|nr:hypothetical protein [Sphingomonas sp. 37zxx]